MQADRAPRLSCPPPCVARRGAAFEPSAEGSARSRAFVVATSASDTSQPTNLRPSCLDATWVGQVKSDEPRRLEAQRRAIRAACRRRGWRLVALDGTQFSLTNTPQILATISRHIHAAVAGYELCGPRDTSARPDWSPTA